MTPPLDQFRSWAKDHGVTAKLVPKESKGMGTGLFVDLAQDADHKDERDRGELLFVPHSLILSRSRIQQLDCPHLQIAFKTVEEHRECILKNNSSKDTSPDTPPFTPSPFAPYVAMLPDVCTPVTLDPGLTRGYLAGTLLLDSVCAKRAKLESEYEFLSGNMGVFEPWPVRPSLDDFVWADATFWSRVLSFGTQWEQTPDGQSPESKPVDDMHMVPYLDFANHAGKANIRWQVDEDGLRVWAKESLLDSIQEDDQDPPKDQGREVYLSYGNKSNTELLFLYGFTLHDNPTKVLTLAVPMDEDDPYYMPKAHTLMRLNIPPRISLHLDNDESEDLMELCHGLWITKDSLCLLWIYSLNEEDGLGALIEEPDLKVCTSDDSANADKDADIEEADLVDEDTVGRLVLTIQGTKVTSREIVDTMIPKLDIYPILVLRSLVLVAHRIEHYIARIMETGDKVQKIEDIEIVRAINYDPSTSKEEGSVATSSKTIDIPVASRLRRNIGDCLLPTLLEPDREHPVTSRQLDVEMLISSLVSVMRSYRTEEMNLLVHIGNLVGEAQTRCLEENEHVKAYLSSMQAQD
ncbi:hypothetical protein BGX34_009957 [Mortierella sp. NVP85]|nr:hypothetical protein BGX34_009957 [Mortierella sp. NVP85]